MVAGDYYNNHSDTQGHSSEKSSFEVNSVSVWPISTCGGISLGSQQVGSPYSAAAAAACGCISPGHQQGIQVSQLLKLQQVVVTHRNLSTGVHSTQLIQCQPTPVSAHGKGVQFTYLLQLQHTVVSHRDLARRVHPV